MSSELPPLRCESRRPRPSDGGAFKWILALVVISASMLDALWLIPAQRAAERRHRQELRRVEQCAKRVQEPRPAPPSRATRADDILLLAPAR